MWRWSRHSYDDLRGWPEVASRVTQFGANDILTGAQQLCRRQDIAELHGGERAYRPAVTGGVDLSTRIGWCVNLEPAGKVVQRVAYRLIEWVEVWRIDPRNASAPG